MARIHRWACQDKRQALEDFERLGERLRVDLDRLGAIDAPATPGGPVAAAARRLRLQRSIADVDAASERARQELAAAERALAQRVQTIGSREATERGAGRRRQRRAGGAGRAR